MTIKNPNEMINSRIIFYDHVFKMNNHFWKKNNSHLCDLYLAFPFFNTLLQLAMGLFNLDVL